MPDFWDEIRKAKLVKLLDEDGMTCAQAAEEFGRTRSAIMGVLHRMGHKRTGRAKPGPKTAVAPLKATKPKPIANSLGQKRFGPKPVSLPKPPRVVTSQCFETGERVTVPIWDLRSQDCKWPFDPVEEGELSTYCGEDTGDAGCSFCPAHAQLAYNPQATQRSNRGVRS